jgi:hypothetical protein
LWGRLKLFTANPEWLWPLATAELRSAWTAEGGRPYANLDGAEPRHHTSLASTRAFAGYIVNTTRKRARPLIIWS